MCKCTPEVKAPFCGKGNCVMPEQASTATPETPPLSRAELDNFIGELADYLFPPLYYVLSENAPVGKMAHHEGDENMPEFAMLNPADFEGFKTAVSETRRLVELPSEVSLDAKDESEAK